MSSARVPPHDLTSEMSTLGSLILAPDAIAVAQSVVEADDFFRDDHRILYRAIVSIFEKNNSIDLVLLKSELERMGKLKEVGGTEYLVRLSESVPSTANAKYYAENVRDMALRRAYISTGTHLVNQAYDVSATMDALSNQVESVRSINEPGGFTTEPTPLDGPKPSELPEMIFTGWLGDMIDAVDSLPSIG